MQVKRELFPWNDPYAENPMKIRILGIEMIIHRIQSQMSSDEFAEKNNPLIPIMNFLSPEKTIRAMHQGRAYFFAIYNDVADTNFWNVQKDVLLDWHYYDPVNDWELNRTWAIASYQENQPTHLY